MLVIYIPIAVRNKSDERITRRGFFKACRDKISKIIINSPGGIIEPVKFFL